LDVDLEATVAGADATLFNDAGVVTVDLALAGGDAARHTRADGDAAADVLLLAVVVAGVLQACDGQIAADIGNDLLAGSGGALQGGVAALVEGQGVAGRQMAVGPADIVTICIAPPGSTVRL